MVPVCISQAFLLSLTVSLSSSLPLRCGYRHVGFRSTASFVCGDLCRCVKLISRQDNAVPVKLVKSRSRTQEEAELFGEWQTQPLVAPAPVDVCFFAEVTVLKGPFCCIVVCYGCFYVFALSLTVWLLKGWIPRSKFGNVELFHPSALPVGCVHIKRAFPILALLSSPLCPCFILTTLCIFTCLTCRCSTTCSAYRTQNGH